MPYILYPNLKIACTLTLHYLTPFLQHDLIQPQFPILHDLHQEPPPDMLEPLGNLVTTSCFVDANHAGNVVMHYSHTEILIFVQNAPIVQYSKSQNTIEPSTFGSEFVVLHIAKDLIVALWYKLHIFGIPPVKDPKFVFCDNEGVVKNTSLPETMLSKKHNAINYHAIWKATAMGIIKVWKEDSKSNLANFLTKILGGEAQWAFVDAIAY